MKGSSKGIIYSVDEAGDIDWWAQSDGSQPSSQSEEEIRFCMVSESSVLSQRCIIQKEDGHKDGLRTSSGGTVKKEESAHTTSVKHSAFWKLSETRTRQRNRYMCSTSQIMASGSEKKLLSAVLSSVPPAGTEMPHLRVAETPEPRRGETCTCAGGNEFKKEVKVTVNRRDRLWHHEVGCIQSRSEDRRAVLQFSFSCLWVRFVHAFLMGKSGPATHEVICCAWVLSCSSCCFQA